MFCRPADVGPPGARKTHPTTPEPGIAFHGTLPEDIFMTAAPTPTPFLRPGPRWLYLHGFASGPSSSKGVAIATHYASRGVAMDRLDLRIPSFEHLRLGA